MKLWTSHGTSNNLSDIDNMLDAQYRALKPAQSFMEPNNRRVEELEMEHARAWVQNKNKWPCFLGTFQLSGW